MARLPCTKVREWVDCAQGGQWPMYSQKGGSLDVVCSSERKKSGSTLRPQHSALSVANLRTKSDDETLPLDSWMGAAGDQMSAGGRPGRRKGARPSLALPLLEAPRRSDRIVEFPFPLTVATQVACFRL